MHRTGYCCINLTIEENFKTMKLTWADKNEPLVEKKWKDIVEHNFNLLAKITDWNIRNNIFLYRISSDLIPFADHDKWGYLWRDNLANGWVKQVSEPARQALKLFRSLGGRLTIHPGQFVSISSPNKETRRKSIANLEYHGELLDLLDLPCNYDCPINIHISNGTKGESVVNNVYESMEDLSISVIRRLVFENEQHGYWKPGNIKKHFKVPITLDFHHLLINPHDEDEYTLDEIVKFTSESWPNNDPVQHWSEGRAHEKDTAHSDYVSKMPHSPFDIEVEAKKKELSVMPHLRTRNCQISNILY
jgi:UV DNA damage endonuclease